MKDMRMTNKERDNERGKKSVESVGEHFQSSDDQGWVQREIEGV